MTLKVKITRNESHAATLFICIYLLANAINSCIKDIFNLSDLQIQIFQYLLMAVLLIFLINVLVCMKKTHLQLFFVIEFLVSLLFVYSMLLGVPFSSLSDWWLTMVSVCIPMFCCAFFIDNFKLLYDRLLQFSWPILVVLVVDSFAVSSSQYDMHFSYGILLIILLHLSEFFLHRKILYLIFSIAEIVLMMAYGSRGSLLCLAVFFVFIILNNVKRIRNRILLIVILALIVIIGGLILDTYGTTLYNSFLASGRSSRTWRLLLTGEFLSHDSGRFELWGNVIQLIGEKPLTGWGIEGAVSRMGHPYPHNLFLDLALSFGIPFGIVASVPLVYSMKIVFQVPKGTAKNLLLIFSCHAFVFLMFSGTIFTNYYFYILMGLVANFSIVRRRKAWDLVKL